MNDSFCISTWTSGSSTSHTLNEIVQIIKERKCKKVFIGCDSHLRGRSYVFAFVIAIYPSSGNGRFFFQRRKVESYSLKHNKKRLLEEVNYSIMLGSLLRELLGEKIEIHTHFDLNPNKAYLSSQIVNHATSYATAMGFIPTLKPDSWASSSIADSKAK